MSGIIVWIVAGTLATVVVLLAVAHKLHQRTETTRSVFRGAALGFLIALPLVAGGLLAPPRVWPPGAGWGWVLALAVPVLTLIGAALGRALAGETGPEDP